MNQIIKEDIINILKQAEGFLDSRDSIALKEISNHTLHNASVFQDKDSITIAVVFYSLSKIIARIEKVEPELIMHIKNARNSLEKDDILGYEKSLKALVDIISIVDKKVNLYVHHILGEAGIKKGSRIYEHGISIAQTAEIFGITQWELMKYLGQTNIPEQFKEEVDIKVRLKKARELFGIVNKV